MPVGIETFGAYGPQAIKLIKQIGKKIQEATGEKLSTFYLMQSISMAIQKGNAVCVRGCPKKHHQAWRASSTFMFKKQKGSDKTFVISIIF